MANVHSDKPKVPEAATRISRDVTNSLKFTLRGGGGGLFKGAPTDGQQPVFQPIELNLGREAVQEIIQAHRLSVTRVHSTLNQVGRDLQDFFPRVPEVLPPRITGQALNPDGTAAASVTVEALKPESLLSNGGIASPWPTRRTVTDHRGVFSLSLPTVPVPERGLRLRFQGGTGTAEAVIPRTDLLDKDGRLGVIALSRTLREAPRSILARLADVVPASGEDVDENPEDFVDPAPVITLGEEDCARSFRSNNGVIDRFDYAILIRLIDPQLSQQELTLRVRESGGQSLPLPVRPRNGTLTPLRALMVQAVQGEATTSLVDRTPIDVPIDVAAFHEDAATDPLGVPEAASLGLGYIVNLHQIWIPVGLSLGDLSYSLPLAPGEEQSIAVFEQNQALEVRDTESLSIAEAQRFDETADSSTLATFESAFREAVRGGSTFDVDSTTGGAGLSLFGGLIGSASKLLLGGGLSAGFASTSSSGSSSSFQNTSRDFVSSAAQDFHSRLARRASASRRASRTGIRLATASDREQVTVKVLANYNHCHALTIQYLEVLRHFGVSTRVDDVQLVCFVPLELIPFLPPGQPTTLPTTGLTRPGLLARYALLLRYLDVLTARLRFRAEFVHGLELLKSFAANPDATVQSSSGMVQDVVAFKATGTFLPFEDIFVTLVTRTGTRVGPIKLVGASQTISSEAATRDQLLEELRTLRQATTGVDRTAFLTLPDFVARSDVSRFELTRQFRPFTRRLKAFEHLTTGDLVRLAAGDLVPNLLAEVSFTPAELERELGGPILLDANAKIQPTGETYIESISPQELPATVLPIPVLRVPPVLSFADLLRIETVFQHVVRNTVEFSKAVWSSLTPEERAILLDPFTIGVPDGGIPDASQEIPLLNCAVNEVLGFFGNSMILPFNIPPQVAESLRVTSRDVQDALLRFHRQAFAPPRTSITLPTRGVLAEAVLGTCNSCEKIDLIRFWNWKDSEPPVKITDLKDLAERFQGQSLIPASQGAAGPSQLTAAASTGTGTTSLLTIAPNATAAPPTSDLLQQLLRQLPTPTAIPDITGQNNLKALVEKSIDKASEAQKEVVDKADSLAQKVLTELPNVLKAQAGLDEEAQKKKEEQTKAAATAAKAVEDQRAANVKALIDGAATFIALAGVTGDPAKAAEVADQVVKATIGNGSLSVLEQAAAFGAFRIDPDKDKDDATKIGKSAFLTRLGLPGAQNP